MNTTMNTLMNTNIITIMTMFTPTHRQLPMSMAQRAWSIPQAIITTISTAAWQILRKSSKRRPSRTM